MAQPERRWSRRDAMNCVFRGCDRAVRAPTVGRVRGARGQPPQRRDSSEGVVTSAMTDMWQERHWLPEVRAQAVALHGAISDAVTTTEMPTGDRVAHDARPTWR